MQTTALLAGGWCLAFGGAFLLWQAWRQGNIHLVAAATATLLASAVLFTVPQSVERGLAFFIPAFVLGASAFTLVQARHAPARTPRDVPVYRPKGSNAAPVVTRRGLARAYLAICGAPAIAIVLSWFTLRAVPLELANKVMLAMGVLIVSFTALLVVVLSAARLAPFLLVSVAAIGLVGVGLLG